MFVSPKYLVEIRTWGGRDLKNKHSTNVASTSRVCAYVRAFTLKEPEGKFCSDLGRVLTLNPEPLGNPKP